MNKKVQDLQAIAARVKKTEGITYGIVANVTELSGIRKKIAKKMSLPEEFYALTREINGIRSDSAELYALGKGKGGYFTDVAKANKKKTASERIVLGETEFDYLVYLPAERHYELQDRICGNSIAIFETLAEALVYMFGV